MRERIIFSIIGVWLLAAVLPACKEVYNPPVISGANNNLVVEGFINTGQGPTQFVLSRSLKLADTVSYLPESGARVEVEGEDNSHYPLAEISGGTYESGQLPLNNQIRYRLHILTAAGREYRSDYSTPQATPPIDSISWQRENGAVQLYVHTHNAASAGRYYRWEYQQTWEFHSHYYSTIMYVRSPGGSIRALAYRLQSGGPDTSIYKCWQSENSSNILIGSSSRLADNVIFLPIAYIPPASWKMSVLFSILVKQYSIPVEAYDYLQKMKKNTESVGSIFDAQPSELVGNIHCLSDPGEVVLGFISAGSSAEKRIFISNADLPGWGYQQDCYEEEHVNKVDTLNMYGDLMPTVPGQVSPSGGILTYHAALPLCVDCTLRGTNSKPGFWP